MRKKTLQKLTTLLLSLIFTLSCTSPIFAKTDKELENIDKTLKVTDNLVNTISEPANSTKKIDNKKDFLITKTSEFDSTKIEKTASYLLKNTVNPTTNTYGGDWSIIALMSAKNAGLNVKISDNFLKNYGFNVKNDMKKALLYPSDYARAILGLESAGIDSKKIGGVNLIEKLTSDMDDISYTSTNAIYTLLALDCKNYDIPNTNVTRDKIIDAILSFQSTDSSDTYSYGGFGDMYDGVRYVSVDTTAMAIQALSPYYLQNNQKVKNAVDNALKYIKANQKESAGFGGGIGTDGKDYDSSCSIAQVMIALCSINIDPLTDLDYIKGENTMYDALMKNYNDKNGAIMEPSYDASWNISGLKDNPMATDQGLIALNAIYLLKQSKNSVYDFANTTPLNIKDASKIVLNKSKITITGVGKSTNLIVYKTPTDTTAPVTYTTSNKKVATVINGKIIAKGAGKAIVTATIKNIYNNNISAKATTNVKLAAPKSVKASAGKKKVTISFKKVAGAKKYEIYKKSGSKFKKIKTISKTKYVDKKVKKGKRYSYKIKAVSGSYKSVFSRQAKSKKVK